MSSYFKKLAGEAYHLAWTHKLEEEANILQNEANKV